jgi:hypothetical protein
MTKYVLSMLGVVGLVVACSSPRAPVEGVTTTGAGVAANKDAALRITNARCEHAKECGDFGKDKKYADAAGCKSEVGHDLEGDFQPSSCPHGVREERLTTCVMKLKDEKCGNISDKINVLAACRRGELCID